MNIVSEERRKTHKVRIGGLEIGGGAPVAVQSMTNTLTANADATAAQVLDLSAAGSELVRFTVKDEDDAKAVPFIVEKVREAGCSVPLVGDFHYNGHILLAKYKDCAAALDKYRINPGNVGTGDHHDSNFRTMVEAAVNNGKAVRIGVNGGSLDQKLLAEMIDDDKNSPDPKGAEAVFLEAMVRSALLSAKAAESYGLGSDKIVLSAKVSRVKDVIWVYRRLASESSYALHVGLTEAGIGMQGLVSSSVAMGILLEEGIGDTIRVSLTPGPGEPRSREVTAAQEILQSLGMRSFFPQVTSCPGCGRTNGELFRSLASEVQGYLQNRMSFWKKEGLKGVENMKAAVMGCIVNGPGEAKDVNIGISLPGGGEEPVAPVFADGKHVRSLRGQDIGLQFMAMIEDYVHEHYAPELGK